MILRVLAKISVIKLAVISVFIKGVFHGLAVISVILIFTSIAQANVVLKVIAVNPSKEQTQKVPVRAYLPKEAKTEDIIDRGDLDIAYDTQQGSYYVYGEYELKPGEILERDIELRDVWSVPYTDVESLREDVRKTTDLLKNTEFGERAAFLRDSIEARLNQILENQSAAPANPEHHISRYRDNVAMLEEAKKDLGLARSLLAQMRPMPTAVVWRLILAIVIFLGVLGGTFYFIWQRQLKTITKDDDTFFVPKEEGEKQEETKEPKNQRTEEQKA